MTIEYKTSDHPVGYPEAIEFMEDRIEKIYQQKAQEMLWFLEHPAIYTAGSSASDNELINQNNFPVYQAGRGGKYTYHGPGQRIVYLMLNLKMRNPDIRKYVENLESWIIGSLAEIGIKSERKAGRIGIWTNDLSGKETKIAAIGIRVRKWVTYHGIAINVKPDLDDFKGIIPCGIKEFGVTSLRELGCDISYQELDSILKRKFYEFF